jgi:hypothetical protein
MKNNQNLPERFSLKQINQLKFTVTNRICYLFDNFLLASKNTTFLNFVLFTKRTVAKSTAIGGLPKLNAASCFLYFELCLGFSFFPYRGTNFPFSGKTRYNGLLLYRNRESHCVAMGLIVEGKRWGAYALLPTPYALLLKEPSSCPTTATPERF